MKNSYFYNPFLEIAGLRSLLIGLAGLLLISLLAFISGTHFNGLLNIDFAKDSSFWTFLTENILNWILVSFFFYVSGLILSRSKIRVIDVFGTVLMSRIPLIITPSIRLIPIFESFMPQSWQYNFVIGTYLLSLVWVVFLLYNAFKISCNLKEVKLNSSFIISLIGSEICTKLLIILLIK